MNPLKITLLFLLVAVFGPSFVFADINIETITYDSKNLSVNPQDSQPYGLFFKPDGTKMYAGGYYNCFIYQYSLSTPWDITTAIYDNLSVDTYTPTSNCSTPLEIFINPNGTEVYFTSADRKVYQFSMSVPWNISTAVYNSKTISTSNGAIDGWGDTLFFKPDGVKMYAGGKTKLFQYTLSTPWDLSTASYDNIFFLTTDQTSWPTGFSLTADGTKGFLAGSTAPSKFIYQYSFGTPWDLSTMTWDGLAVDLSEDIADIGVQAIYINPDTTKLFATSLTFSSIYSFSFPDSTPPSTSTLSPTDNADGATLNSNLVITFDEAVNVGTGNIVIHKTSDTSVFDTIDVTSGLVTGSGTNTITINPTVDLDYGSYYIKIDTTAFDDTAGNSYAGIADATTWNFDTISAPQRSSGSRPRVTVIPDLSSTASASVCKPGDTYSTNTGLPCSTFTSPSSSSSSSSSSCIITITLKYGSRGGDVKCLQQRLNILADGIFGPMTHTSVIAFQKAHGLATDGIVGPLTRGALNK